ncbi:MAG: hypothetical protein ACOCXZ_03170 [Chloroflexota bacterium]
MYMPTIKDARRDSTFIVGPYIAVVLTDCESVGQIEYRHVMFVYLPDPTNRDAPPQVIMAVAAEMSSVLKAIQQPDEPERYFLGVFPGDGHHNLGASADWADLGKFRDRALEVVREHLKIEAKPFRVPDSGSTPTHD